MTPATGPTPAALRVPARTAPPAVTGGQGSWRGSLTATRRLIRLVVRRDRVRLPIWVASLVGLMAVSAQSIQSLYGTDEAAQAYVATVGDNPALEIFAGPGYGFDRPTPGAVLVNETMLWLALATGLMSVFLVNRHTRAEEESERADLVRSAVVGRHAPVVAAMAVTAGANLAVAVGVAAVTLPFGFPVAGTLALAASIGLVGLAFGAATAVAAQVVGTGRGAVGLGSAVLGLAFVLRGIGDIRAPALSWLTPFGWGIGVRAYAGERWWTLAGLAAFIGAGTASALVLSARRDLGRGLLPERPGPARAGALTVHPLGLTWRLQRGSVMGWAVGVFVAGLVYGSVADDVEAMMADNPQLADYLQQIAGASLADAYLATAVQMLSLAVGGFAVASALRNRSEEAAGYAEMLLAAPVSRWRWGAVHVVVTLVASVGLVALSGLGTGIAYAQASGDAGQLGTMTLAALASAPAVLVMAGIATLLFGWAPRAAPASWAALALFAVVQLFATVLRLPHWMTLLSPFGHVPSVPAEPWRLLPLAVLGLLAAALVGGGLAGFRRRDLAAD